MLHPYILPFGQFAQLGGDALFLILPSVNLVQPLQTDFRILQFPAETDECTHGSVQLPDDVRQRHHHPQGHFPFHHCLGREERNHDVRRLAEEYRTYLLHLSQCHPLHAYLEQLHLYAFPLPPLLPFAVVQLYFLHPRYQLYQAALLARSLCEAADVQLPAVLHEHQYPGNVQRVPEEEQQQDAPVVISQYRGEHEEVHQREQRTDRRTRQERFDAVMVSDALQNVAHHLRVEEPQGQFHQLDEEVRNQRNVDSSIHMQ